MSSNNGTAVKTDDSRRIRRPPLVRGILSSHYEVIPAEDVEKLRIDESYQRGRIDSMAMDLAYVLRNQGQVPSPVHLVERADGGRYIVDGQQRFWAHVDAGMALPAMVHRVRDYETEKLLFIALNSYARVTPGVMVRSWPGPSASLIIEASLDRQHPLYNRVNFGLHGGGRTGQKLFGAVALLHGIATAADGVLSQGQVVKLLAATDSRVVPAAARARAETFLLLAAEVFPTLAARALYLRALAQVAYSRWGNAPTLPKDGVLRALRRIHWKDLVPAYTDRFRPLVMAEIEKRWPKERWRS